MLACIKQTEMPKRVLRKTASLLRETKEDLASMKKQLHGIVEIVFVHEGKNVGAVDGALDKTLQVYFHNIQITYLQRSTRGKNEAISAQ